MGTLMCCSLGLTHLVGCRTRLSLLCFFLKLQSLSEQGQNITLLNFKLGRWTKKRPGVHFLPCKDLRPAVF